MRPVCYLDMDGVIADFVTSALYLHGLISKVKAHEVGWDFWTQHGISHEDFWKDMGYEFWRDIPLTEEFHKLVPALLDLFGPDHIVIVSSPCQTPGCVEGKREWIRKWVPALKNDTFFGKSKHKLAGGRKILVDDHTPNVDAFRRAGGKAVLVPRPWNERKDEAMGFACNVDNVIKEVRSEYESLWPIPVE